MSLLNALTVDVEDYFQVSAFEHEIDRDRWGEYESRVVANTHRILRSLDGHQVQATFFILGWVAHRFPQLVRDVHRSGHEVASHSYWHRLIYEMTPDEFREDLRLSRDVLQQTIGQAVTSYRAPSFSITNRSLWALEILAEEGFRIDSSIFPIVHDRYGVPDAPQELHRIETPAGQLVEFPPSVLRLGRWNLPVCGGGYFRLYPWAWTQYCLSRINREREQPFVFYVHPWEYDADQPRLGVGSRLARFRHYVNLSRTQDKFELLLRKFRFGRLCDVVADSQPLLRSRVDSSSAAHL